jgi:hypothetical protein
VSKVCTSCGEEALSSTDHGADAFAWATGIEGVWIDELGTFKMTQTADPFLREQQMKIRSVLRRNAARRLNGKKKCSIKWVKGKRAQCMLIGHVMIAKKCVYCGAEE